MAVAQQNNEATRSGPLAGYRVLEMGSTVAGPFCGRLLADFGAEVIKVEPIEGDPVRTMGKRYAGKSLYAASILRNKSLIAVDLRSSEGQALVRKLVAQCDVVVENFRPGGLEKWGLGYDDLAKLNPGLVMVRISGFGQTGPYRERAGYGVIGEAISGLRHITGDPDRPPARAAVSLTDYFTGLYAAFGATMALLSRHATGRGQCVDAALYECAFSFMEPHIPAYEKLGYVANRAGSRLPDSTPNNLYPTRDHSFIHITAMGDAVFKRLAAVMQRPGLADDARFASNLARSEHSEALDALIGTWTLTHNLSELEQVLAAANVPATRIFTMRDIFSDPHFKARDMLVDVPDEQLGKVTMAGVVPRLSDTPGVLRTSGGEIGRDTRQVLTDLAGLSAEEIEQLRDRGVIHLPPVNAGAAIAAI
ncbi:CaiB/BaiF CoA-transferase family protein [Pandoraea sp.]|uniref:CaiB/BaiF CoA transferase family protein n=1 Tax=Pandoraea sp. TaxID=1883445 RepID=UPI001205C914|nr:CaiB/BaiF CoA-transferase family protein [Pandoraea sp.]TAL57073.1 MAG: CoA transferase [Pandoraea sp.]TAM18115.1 MAG: CoA transferase [Pandoraea sp.]